MRVLRRMNRQGRTVRSERKPGCWLPVPMRQCIRTEMVGREHSGEYAVDIAARWGITERTAQRLLAEPAAVRRKKAAKHNYYIEAHRRIVDGESVTFVLQEMGIDRSSYYVWLRRMDETYCHYYEP